MTITKSVSGLFAALIILCLSANIEAAANPGIEARSSILMNMTTGRILYARNVDDLIPPASITKVLTLYIADEEIREGRIHPRDPVKISRKAGQTGGSKMFVQTGSRIPLEELLKGVAVVSANDASVAIAEHIEGNVERFVERMNQKARELGMTSSTFRNPNGLPAQGQFTTARDMLVLAREYLQRFPESLGIHSQQYFTYRNITQHNRNALLWSYPNADGLKTGWIVKSGYHIIATAKRDENRLIAIVMGAKNPALRNREAQWLLDEGFRLVREQRG